MAMNLFMGRKGLAALAVLVGAVLGGGESAVAQYLSDGWCGPSYYWRSYNNALGRVPPYFAEFPPVYYSHPVARPYGFYPYAYPAAWHQRVERVPVNYRWLRSRAVVQPPAPEPLPEPAVVVNPYCDPKADVDSALTSTDGARPQVVYPAELVAATE